MVTLYNTHKIGDSKVVVKSKIWKYNQRCSVLIVHRTERNLSVIIDTGNGRLMIDLLAIRTGTAGRTGTGEHSKAIPSWCRKLFSESGL